jgi:MarR family transcriptional regulator for hemolysin
MPLMEIETFGPLVHDAARLLRKRFEARGRDMGLSSAQWRLLIRLLREGPTTQARLAELLEVEPISVSRLVDRMATAGWVERRKDPSDRRVHIVAPTDKALGAMDAIRKIANEVYAEAIVGVSPGARQQMIGTLRLIVENLSQCDEPVESMPADEGTR